MHCIFYYRFCWADNLIWRKSLLENHQTPTKKTDRLIPNKIPKYRSLRPPQRVSTCVMISYSRCPINPPKEYKWIQKVLSVEKAKLLRSAKIWRGIGPPSLAGVLNSSANHPLLRNSPIIFKHLTCARARKIALILKHYPKLPDRNTLTFNVSGKHD